MKAVLLWLRLTALLALALPLRAAEPLPAWLKSVSDATPPAYPAGTPAVVLLDEATVELDAKGVATTVIRHALRVLHGSGDAYARAHLTYLQKSDRVSDQRAWIIRKGEVHKAKQPRDWADVSDTSDAAVFGEYRAKTINLSDAVVAGDVFAFEARLVQPLLVAQYQRNWGSTLPVLRESLTLCLPPGFGVDAFHNRIPAPTETRSADGRCITWLHENLPYLPDEPAAIAPAKVHGSSLVRIRPPAGTAFSPLTFDTWPDVARWAESLSTGQCDSNAALEDKTRELTAGAGTTLEKVRALCRYVQQLRYVALDNDLGKGSGYKPRRATAVFAQGYGDCKDKANLLRSMLRVAGITSYVAIAKARPDFVPAEEVPSPRQFDHAISAIVVDTTVDLPAVVTAPTGERLLLFDPTHRHVELGHLPEPLQGSRIYVLSPDHTHLLDVPVAPPARGNRVERGLTLSFTETGSLQGEATLHGIGEAATYWRGVAYGGSTPLDLEKAAAASLGASLKSARVSAVETVTAPEDIVTGVRYHLTMPEFLQPMPGGLLVARLELFNRADVPSFNAKERVRPVRLAALEQVDRAELALPPRITAEELPAPAHLQSRFGTYERKVAIEDGKLMFRRRLEVVPQEVAISDYASLRSFFAEVARADRTAVLLRARAEP